MTTTKTVEVYERQHDFLASKARYRLFRGGRGSGKSYAGALAGLAESKPNEVGLVLAPTYDLCKKNTLKTFIELAEPLGIQSYNKSELEVVLSNGAIAYGRSADRLDRLRGFNAAWLWLDESRDMSRETWLVGIATLRVGAGRAWATSTPHGYDWQDDVFGKNPDAEIFEATMFDNPYTPDHFKQSMLNEYGDGNPFALQELYGKVVTLSGGLFDVEKIEIIDYVPDCIKVVRFYDLAVTEKATSDYTVGGKLGLTKDNRFVILDVYRVKKTLPDVLVDIKQNAIDDGPDVLIYLEAEKAGIVSLDFLLRDGTLNNFTIRTQVPQGDKYTRAAPVAARLNAGRFMMVRGIWNRALLDELAAFPEVKHDDQTDTLSGGYKVLAEGSSQMVSFVLNSPNPVERPSADPSQPDIDPILLALMDAERQRDELENYGDDRGRLRGGY